MKSMLQQVSTVGTKIVQVQHAANYRMPCGHLSLKPVHQRPEDRDVGVELDLSWAVKHQIVFIAITLQPVPGALKSVHHHQPADCGKNLKKSRPRALRPATHPNYPPETPCMLAVLCVRTRVSGKILSVWCWSFR